jgi:DNA-binding MurR/RpiR family transcriptional regulator
MTGNMGILSEIKERLEKLPSIQKSIAQYILQNPEEVVRMSISHLARQSGAKSEASVVKFYGNLGFSGYHDFKVALATEIAGRNFDIPDSDNPISIDDDVPSIRKKIFQSCMLVLEKNINSIDDAVVEKVVSILHDANRVFILGYGTSAVAGYDLYIKLSRLGLDCHFSLDAHANALVLSDPRPGDVVFAISFSGESKDIIYQVRDLKGVIPILALTGESSSPLAQVADVCISIQSFETTYRTDAMVGRIVHIALMDVIFTALAVKGGDKALARLTRSRQGLSFLKL